MFLLLLLTRGADTEKEDRRLDDWRRKVVEYMDDGESNVMRDMFVVVVEASNSGSDSSSSLELPCNKYS